MQCTEYASLLFLVQFHLLRFTYVPFGQVTSMSLPWYSIQYSRILPRRTICTIIHQRFSHVTWRNVSNGSSQGALYWHQHWGQNDNKYSHPHTTVVYIITHPFPNINGCLAKPPLKLGHGWVITSRGKQFDVITYPCPNLSWSLLVNCVHGGNSAGLSGPSASLLSRFIL